MSIRKPSSFLRARGFSLLEMTVALGVSGILFSGIWQLTSAVGQQKESAAITSQTVAVTAAAQNYISSKRATLLALAQLGTLDSVAIIKITSADTGHTADSLQSSGFLPSSFTNLNSYGQQYILYVQRQDSGTIGAIDPNDKLVGLLITNGGTPITDMQGARIASGVGAAGGFMYSTNNPAAPTPATTVTGSNGGWSVNLSATGWSSVVAGSAVAGRIGVYVNLLPSGGSGTATGPTALDDLDDAQTNYVSNANVYVGLNAGQSNVLGGFSTAMGQEALQWSAPTITAAQNTAMGYRALRGLNGGPAVTGTKNTALGAYALENFVGASRNTAVGVYADRNNQANHDRTAVGFNAGLNCSGNEATLVGVYAGACESGAMTVIGSTIVGANTGRNAAGIYNSLAGSNIGSVSGHTGSYNSAVGYQALNNITALGQFNLALGYQAGANLTDGSSNIMIGNGTVAANPTGNFQLNIGNYIYGDMTTKQLNFGSATMVSGITLDVGSRTDSARLAVGTTAQRPTCASGLTGAQRWNTDDATVEFCNGTAWSRPIMAYSGGTPPVAPLNPGYIVMTQAEWDGNLGGISGANAKCWSDLSANDWMGKSAAISSGQFTTSNVKAFICGQGGGACNTATPLSIYYFARSGSPSSGGASFTTDAYGGGPRNSINWAGANYFNSAVDYWSNRPSINDTRWGNGDAAHAYAGGDACDYWKSNLATKFAIFGSPSNTNAWRWASGGYGYGRTCDQMLRLICMVHP